MYINNNNFYQREIQLDQIESSCFLFGPRMTGKTSILMRLSSDIYYNLLDPQVELRFRTRPHEFWEEISYLKPGTQIIVDEIQRIPTLLDYIQMGIDQKQIQFLLSGSSARKIKRGSANLLGGRALNLQLHPLTEKELGKDFDIHNTLKFGTLPLISSLLLEGKIQTIKRQLKSYVTTYIKEEIQAEALVRNVDGFHRFLSVASACNGQMIAFANISRECSVHQSTVKEHYSILEDTLIGHFVWPFHRSQRKKARPKFYFFDCGVVRALQSRMTEDPNSQETGVLFETWIANELIRIRDYLEYEHTISLWREGRWEIDFLIESNQGPLLAIECKSGQHIQNKHTINAFKKHFPKVPLIICSLHDQNTRKLQEGVWVENYKKTIQRYRELNFVL